MMVLSNSVNKSLMLRSPFNQVCKRQISEATVQKGMSIWAKTIVACTVVGTVGGFICGVEDQLERCSIYYMKPSQFVQFQDTLSNGIYCGFIGTCCGILMGFSAPVSVPLSAYIACRVHLSNQKAKTF